MFFNVSACLTKVEFFLIFKPTILPQGFLGGNDNASAKIVDFFYRFLTGRLNKQNFLMIFFVKIQNL